MLLRYIIYGIVLPSLLSFAACETASNSPDAFLKARFPLLADGIEWDSSKANEIGAFFSDSTTGYEVYFDKKGRFQKLYTYVSVTDLPDKVAQPIQQKYPNCKWNVLSLVETPKTKFYHVELMNDKDYITVEVDATGGFLNEKVVPLSEQELRDAEEEWVDDDY